MKWKEMVQQFTESVKVFWKKTDKYGILLILVLAFLLYQLFSRFYLTDLAAINQLLTNLIQFSGIFSAILITYVIGKVLQTRQERIERRKEIVKLANKLTDFRRIARVLVQCYGFWDKDMRQKIDNKYKYLSFFDIHNWDYDNQNKKYPKELNALRDEYFKEENLPGAGMYMDMKSLVLDQGSPWQLELYDKHDHDFTYSLEILEEWTGAHSGNNLWYCLEHKRAAYDGCFNFHAFRQHEQEEILHLAKKIDSKKYGKRKFDSELLADIGGEMASFYIPRLHELTYYNTTPLSRTLNFLLTMLFVTMITGVVVPLLLTAIKVGQQVLLVTSSVSVSTLCLSLFYFLLKFKRILNNEIKIE